MKKFRMQLALVATIVALESGCSSAPSAEDFSRVSSALRVASAAGAEASAILQAHAADDAAGGDAKGSATILDVAAKMNAASKIAQQGAGDVDLLGSLVTGSPAPATSTPASK